MKRFAIILVIALSALAPMANAQGLNLGAVIQMDEKRLEVSPNTSFSAAAYTARPPKVGFDSEDLVGLFSSSLGQYPMIYTGVWMKITVFPGGFTNLEGVDFDPSGKLKKDAKEGWLPLYEEGTTPDKRKDEKVRDLEETSPVIKDAIGGGFSMVWRADRLGALPLRFRIRHRDGRDKYSLLIFSATWTRGGNLPTALEIMTQRAPRESLQGEDALPYLRGFIPATATRSDAGMTTQKVEVPPQTVTQTASNNGGSTTSGNGNVDARAGNAGSSQEKDVEPEYATPVIGTYQVMKGDGYEFGKKLTNSEKELVGKARKSAHDQNITEIRLNTERRWTLVTLTDRRAFTARIVIGEKEYILKPTKNNLGQYESIVWANTQNLIGATLLVVDVDNRLRTITFAEDRPEDGQGGQR